MKTLLLLLSITIPPENLLFQKMPAAPKTEKKENNDASKCIYQFETFKEGKVYFKNGKYTPAKLNYNYLHGGVEFINPANDTLLLTGKEFVDHILIGGNVFYSQQKTGEVEIVGNFNNILLAKKKYLVIKGNAKNMSDRKLTASNESAIPSSLLINNQNGEFQWQNNTSRPEYKYKTTYYLIDRNRVFHLAKKSAFVKIYSKEQKTLTDLLRKNDIDFDNEDQLKQLLKFCSEI